MSTDNEQKKEAVTNFLKPYLKIGMIDDLTEGQHKELATYYAPLKPTHENHREDSYQSSHLIVKELDAMRVPIYEKLTKHTNPYLEHIFGVTQIGGRTYSFQECIQPPSLPEIEWQELSLSLEDYVRRVRKGMPFSETEALIFLYELCEGLKGLHKEKLFHGDLSPQNILLTDAEFFTEKRFQKIEGIHQKIAPKIIDFGNAKDNKEKNHQVTTIMGTKPYAAPDILDFHNPTDQRADIYSLGCILSFMLTGISPKQGEVQSKVSKSIWKIIETCTASYYERFANVEKLQKRILKELRISSSVTQRILWSIPGFRSHNYLKMAVACYFYFSFLFGGISAAYAKEYAVAIIMPTLFLISVICLFDVFHLMDLAKGHCYFLRKHKIMALLIRLLVSCLIILGASMFLGRYL